jgi:hypothetical protein
MTDAAERNILTCVMTFGNSERKKSGTERGKPRLSNPFGIHPWNFRKAFLPIAALLTYTRSKQGNWRACVLTR